MRTKTIASTAAQITLVKSSMTFLNIIRAILLNGAIRLRPLY